jgi:hypothetical protein
MRNQSNFWLVAILVAAVACTTVQADVIHWYQFGPNDEDLSVSIASDDLINGFGINTNGSPINEGLNESAISPYGLGFIDFENDVTSWLMASGGCLSMISGLPSDGFFPNIQLPPSCQNAGQVVLTDGIVNDDAPCSGLLRDFGRSSLVIRYGFQTPTDVGRLRIYAANFNNRDGRVFQNYDVYARQGDCADGICPAHVDEFGNLVGHGPGEFNLVASGVTTANFGIGNNTQWQATVTEVYDTDSPVLVAGCTDLRIVFYSVDNTGSFFVDPWQGYANEEQAYIDSCSGPEPAEPDDLDGYRKAFVASLIKEIDVLPPGRSPLANADYDDDVDLVDMAALQRCTGADVYTNGDMLESVCSRFDLDLNNQVDAADWALIEGFVSGPQ